MAPPTVKVLPAVFGVLEEDGSVVCLIKPQFELEREDISKGGIVRDPSPAKIGLS